MRNSIMFAMASAAAFALMAAAPAAAQNFAREPQQIGFSDLDLNDQQGARAMLGRLEHTAGAQCGDRSGPMTLAERNAINRCVSRKVDSGVEQVGNSNLTAVYYGRRPSITVDGR